MQIVFFGSEKKEITSLKFIDVHGWTGAARLWACGGEGCEAFTSLKFPTKCLCSSELQPAEAALQRKKKNNTGKVWKASLSPATVPLKALDKFNGRSKTPLINLYD